MNRPVVVETRLVKVCPCGFHCLRIPHIHCPLILFFLRVFYRLIYAREYYTSRHNPNRVSMSANKYSPHGHTICDHHDLILLPGHQPSRTHPFVDSIYNNAAQNNLKRLHSQTGDLLIHAVYVNGIIVIEMMFVVMKEIVNGVS